MNGLLISPEKNLKIPTRSRRVSQKGRGLKNIPALLQLVLMFWVTLSSPTDSYSTRGDGLLLSTTFNGGSYTYGYGTDGLLLSRTTPVQSVSVTGRDPVGRLLGQQQSALGSVILNESLSYNLDGRQASYSATRATSVNGTSAPAWNESRSYRYDLRSHLTSESFAPASNSVNQYIFQYDGNSAGGLGLRTQVGLSNGTNGGTAIGTFTENYPNFAQLGNYQANGSLSSVIAPLSTNTVASYDQEGNLISRTPNTGTAGATDALTYDALGRLIGVTRTGSNALTWSAVYDGLGRRVATVQGSLVIQSSFDPEHEFEEVAVTVGSARNWFIHGPDLNGLYGAMQGTGGTEGVYNESSGLMTSVLNDAYGDSVASITSGLFAWNPVRATGYGPMWGSTPVPVSGSYALGSLLNWRGHYIDGIGTYHLGARDLQYQTGTWMEPDPLGHAASWDLHQAFNGDPVNVFDPDGRFATSVGNKIEAAALSYAQWDLQQVAQQLDTGDQFNSAFSSGNYSQASGIAAPILAGSLVSTISIEAKPIRIAIEGGYRLLNEGAAEGGAETRIDYSNGFLEDTINFNEGSVRYTGTLDSDLTLVQYHDADVALGEGRSAKWWTSTDQANQFSTVDDLMEGLALPPNWGERNAVSIAVIPKGTSVDYLFGIARSQVGVDGVPRRDNHGESGIKTAN